jgi:heme/copper-type cytochrome/quinol oxidase subunit 2
MKIKVTVVDSDAEYNTWLASQAPLVAPVVAEQVPAKTESKTDTTAAVKTVAMN